LTWESNGTHKYAVSKTGVFKCCSRW